MNEKAYKQLERSLTALLKELKHGIGDDYRASDDPDDNTPGMCVTVGATPQDDGSLSWHYQTGDNSYSGGAYGHHHWGVISLYRKSNCVELARECVEQIAESISQTEAA